MLEKGWFREVLVVGKHEDNSLKENILLYLIMVLVIVAFGLVYAAILGKFDSIVKYFIGDTFSFTNAVAMIEEIIFIINISIYIIIFSMIMPIGLLIYRILSVASSILLYLYSRDYLKYCKICGLYWQRIDSKKIRMAQIRIASVMLVIATVSMSVVNLRSQAGIDRFYLITAVLIFTAVPLLYYVSYKSEVGQLNGIDIWNRTYTVVRWSHLAGYKYIMSVYRLVAVFVIISFVFVPFNGISFWASIKLSRYIELQMFGNNINFKDWNIGKDKIRVLIENEAKKADTIRAETKMHLIKNKTIFRMIFHIIVLLSVVLILCRIFAKYLIYKKQGIALRSKILHTFISFCFSAIVALSEKYVYDGQSAPWLFGLVFTTSFAFFISTNTQVASSK